MPGSERQQQYRQASGLKQEVIEISSDEEAEEEDEEEDDGVIVEEPQVRSRFARVPVPRSDVDGLGAGTMKKRR